MNSRVTVAYADDHVAVRQGIVSCLESDKTIQVVLQGSNGQELLEGLLAATELPQVCLLDINMPRMSGFVLLREIKKRWPELHCLVLTAFEVESYIIEMIKAGANGYLLKSCDPDEMVEAVHMVRQYGYYYSAVANQRLFNAIRKSRENDTFFSDREIEFLKYVCDDISYADIARQMNTTYRTIDGLRERLSTRLGVSSRVGLVLTSIELGFYTIQSPNYPKIKE
ncbi:MAG TPA: response regulator transcription factor [Chitinophagaceae bacterium]|nr:response regulator transcription factor [Chitinophagaceae bacterium]